MLVVRCGRRTVIGVLVAASLMLCGTSPSAVATDPASSLVQHEYRFVYAGPDGSGEVVVPQPPVGVSYVKWEVSRFDDASGQFSGALLRSDGKMVGFGESGIKGVEAIEREFPGASIRDFTKLRTDGAYLIFQDGTLHRTVGRKDRNDSFDPPLGEVGMPLLAGPWDMPDCVIPEGGFARFLPAESSSVGEMLLLRLDGRVTAFLKTFADENGERDIQDCFTTARGDYVGGTIGSILTSAHTDDRVTLLRKDGRLDVYDVLLKKLSLDVYSKTKSLYPELPKGIRYVDVAGNGIYMGYLRSDGRMAYRTPHKWLQPVKQQPPVLPVGLKYVSLSAWNDSWIVMRSDGQAVVLNGGTTQYSGNEVWRKFRPHRQLPQLGKGWRYVSGQIPRDNETIFLVERITSGQKVATGIEKINAPKSAVKGKTVKVTVKVASRAILDGGIVKVTYNGKTVGKAKVKGAKAVIIVKTKTMQSKSKNTIGVQYLGNNQAKKSVKAKVTLTTRTINRV